MKTLIRSKLLTAALLGLAGLLLPAASSQAQNFHVTINTAALTILPNAANGPFSLDLQLNSGLTLNNNSAVVSNITFGGGAPFGPATTINGASGTLPGPVILTDSGAFNEFFQSFAAGSTLAFDLSLSSNLDAGGTPDVFSLALLDNNLFNIPTTGLGDSLFLVTFTGGAPTVEAFMGTGDFAGVLVSFAPIPEPATYGAIIGAVALLGAVRNRRRRQADVAA